MRQGVHRCARGWSPVFNGRANFNFTYNCDPNRVKGTITYHDTSTNGLFPGLKLYGTVENTLIDAHGDPLTDDVKPAAPCQEIIEAPAAHFEGSYRSLEKRYCTIRGGRFHVFVFDQGNTSLPAGDFNGDGFSIELSGRPYPAYTRAGYIEGGNIYANWSYRRAHRRRGRGFMYLDAAGIPVATPAADALWASARADGPDGAGACP
jgi:hypothetical protein